jgi:hypothetical protein
MWLDVFLLVYLLLELLRVFVVNVLYCTVGTRDIDKIWRKISKVLCNFKTRFYNSVFRNTERFLAFLPLSFQKVFNVL